MGFKDDMQEFDQDWETAQAEPRKSGAMLRGKHQAQVVECRVEQQQDERWVWNIKFKNDQGTVRKFQNLDHEVGRDIAAQDAALMGYTGPLSNLEEVCAAGTFDDLICEINVVTKPGNEREFVDVYINRVLGKGETMDSSEVAPAAAGTAMDDDIPF